MTQIEYRKYVKRFSFLTQLAHQVLLAVFDSSCGGLPFLSFQLTCQLTLGLFRPGMAPGPSKLREVEMPKDASPQVFFSNTDCAHQSTVGKACCFRADWG